MTKDQMRSIEEALDLALEALEKLTDTEQTYEALDLGDKAITAIKQARALDKKADNAMIYKTFEQWMNGDFLEVGEPRKKAYSKDELLLVEMGWNYGYDAGRAVEQALDKKADNARELGLDYEPVQEPVAFQIIRGELCYKSQDDDQSYGMWCPVTPQTDLPFVDGTKLYTTPPAAQPAPVQEPVAWMRKWAFDGEVPTKVKNGAGRWCWPTKYKLLPITQGQCLNDDVPLCKLTTPPAAQPVRTLEELYALSREVSAEQSTQQDIQRLSALVRAQQITIDKLEAQPAPVPKGYKQSPEHSEVFTKAQLLQYGADCVKAAQPAPAQSAERGEPVATKLETQQFNCFHVSAEDFQRLKALPVGAKLYTTPPAAPVQEPLFWYKPYPNGMYNGPVHNAQIGDVLRGSEEWRPLYTTPPAAQRQWVGLTEEEIKNCIGGMFRSGDPWLSFSRAIEAKLRSKNGY